MSGREVHLGELARALQEHAPGRVFWSGAGFLDEVVDPLRAAVGEEWGIEAAEGYISFQSFSDALDTYEKKMLTVVLASPCPPDQLAAIVSLHRAGYLACLVMLEHQRPASIGGWILPAPFSPLLKKYSPTASYLDEMGFHDLGLIKWDVGEKHEDKLITSLGMATKYAPSYLVMLLEEHEMEYEIDSGIISSRVLPRRMSKPKLEGSDTVFDSFFRHIGKLIESQQLTWLAPDNPHPVKQLEGKFRIYSSLEDDYGEKRPVFVISSSLLPALYSILRLWCTSARIVAPVLIIYNSGLTKDGQESFSALNDLHLLLSIPELVIAKPSDELEAQELLKEALERREPTALVFTQAPAIGLSYRPKSSAPPEADGARQILGRKLRAGKDVVVLTIGSTVYPGLLAAESLQSIGVEVAVYDLRYQRPVDRAVVEQVALYPFIITAEEGPRSSSFASSLYSYSKPAGRLIQLSIEPSDLQKYQNSDLASLSLENFSMHAEGIARTIKNALGIGITSSF